MRLNILTTESDRDTLKLYPHGSPSPYCVLSGSVDLTLCVMLFVSEANVSHNEVKRDTAGRRLGESNTTRVSAKVTHQNLHTRCHVARSQSACARTDSLH